MEKKKYLIVVPDDPFEDPLPWLEKAARKFEEDHNQESSRSEPAQDTE